MKIVKIVFIRILLLVVLPWILFSFLFLFKGTHALMKISAYTLSFSLYLILIDVIRLSIFDWRKLKKTSLKENQNFNKIGWEYFYNNRGILIVSIFFYALLMVLVSEKAHTPIFTPLETFLEDFLNVFKN